MGLYGFKVMRSCGFTVIGLCGFTVMIQHYSSGCGITITVSLHRIP